MKNKIAIVTGGTSGIGLSIVKALSEESYLVYFIGTNARKGKAIERQYKSKFVKLDLGNLEEIRNFVDSLKSIHNHIDLLANIAGGLYPQREETEAGIEKNFAISYLSAFYLTNELIPLLKQSSEARIVNVAADPSIINKAQLDFKDLNSKKAYNGFKASTNAVHAKTVYTQTLSEKLTGSNITVNSFHPGNIQSGLFRNMASYQRAIMKLFTPFFGKECKRGIQACLSEDVVSQSGLLFAGKKTMTLDFDKNYQSRLWDESEKFIQKLLLTENNN